jgi:hypothetical protein
MILLQEFGLSVTQIVSEAAWIFEITQTESIALVDAAILRDDLATLLFELGY